MSSRARVLVTDGNERAALAVTRGLGQAGISVIVGAETRSSLAGASRYSAGKWCYPSPLVNRENFIESIKKAVKRFEIKHILSVTDAATQMLAEWKADLGAAGLIVPSLDSYTRVSDKYRLMQLAKQLGIPIPDTVFVPDGQVGKVINEVTKFPVVVKPGRSIQESDRRRMKTSVHFAADREELVELYRQVPYLSKPSLIQQRIEGSGQGIFGLFDHGRPCALFAHRRIREKPPAWGVSVLRESIELPKPMTEYAVRLLEQEKWHGVAMVEFKVDRTSGIPMLMEINGRFWGSLQLATDAGLNFPHLLYQMASGESVALFSRPYRIGVKSRWLLGDLDHLLLRLTKSKAQLTLDSRAPSRWRCLAEFFRFFQRDLHYEIERWDDLGPALVEYRTWLGQVVGTHA